MDPNGPNFTTKGENGKAAGEGNVKEDKPKFWQRLRRTKTGIKKPTCAVRLRKKPIFFGGFLKPPKKMNKIISLCLLRTARCILTGKCRVRDVRVRIPKVFFSRCAAHGCGRNLR